MKKTFLFTWVSFLTLVAFSSCDKESDPTNNLSVNILSIVAPAVGGEYGIELSANDAWTAESSENWCTITPSSGTNNSTVAVTVDANENSTERSATIRISAAGVEKTISVTQAGKDAVVGIITLTSAQSEIILSISAQTATIDWGDGNTNTYTGKDVECKHTYATTESHTITITGTEFYLFRSYYNLTSIDLSKNPALTELYCIGNTFTTLDISDNEELIVLDCEWNKLTQLDVSHNKKLRQLSCEFNDITGLNLTGNTALEVLELRNNDLTNIDLSKNTALTVLDISDNPHLTTIDISHNTALLSLYVYIGSLTSLDLSQNTALINLNIQITSSLTSLDLSHNPHLFNLVCEQTSITSLDLSNNPELVRVWCRSNNLTNLKFCSTSTALTSIVCGFNSSLSTDALNTALASLPTITGTHPATMTFLPYNDGSGLPYWEELDDRLETSPEMYEIEMYDIFIGISTCDKTIATNKGWTVSESGN